MNSPFAASDLTDCSPQIGSHIDFFRAWGRYYKLPRHGTCHSVSLLHVYAGFLNSSDGFRAQLFQKTTNVERIIHEEYQTEVLGFPEIAKSRKAEIRGSLLDQSLRNLNYLNMRMLVDTSEDDVSGEMFLGSFIYSILRYHH